MELSAICKIKLITGDVTRVVDKEDIESISQMFGDLVYLSDICGMGWMRCPDCIGKSVGCQRRFISGKVKGQPEPIEIIFKNGNVELVDSYEFIS